jgi:hypothetical protein
MTKVEKERKEKQIQRNKTLIEAINKAREKPSKKPASKPKKKTAKKK